MLAAATAAVFVCAPAGAIEITSISPSGSYWDPAEVIEHMNNMVDIRTDVDFKRVEWTFNGKTSIDNGTEDGTDTYSAFIPTLDGLGRPWGVRYAITATAYDNDDVSVSATTWFRVWRASNYIRIVDMSGSSDVVISESFEADLETNAGFGRVEWYLKEVRAVVDDEKNYGDLMDTAYGPDYKASFSHTFEDGDGSNLENGKAYRITAKAYDISNPSGTPVVTDIEQIIVNVHEGKGKRAISGDSNINSYFYIDPEAWTCQLDWEHGLTYYNDYSDPDDSKAHFYASAKVIEVDEDGDEQEVAVFRSGDKENGVGREDLVLNLNRTFRGSVYEFYYSKLMKNGDVPLKLIAGRKYKLVAAQGLKDSPEAQRDPRKRWKDRDSGGNQFISQTRRFDPDDEFDDGGLEWEKGWNDVYEE